MYIYVKFARTVQDWSGDEGRVTQEVLNSTSGRLMLLEATVIEGPQALLRSAIKAVPAVKYALGIGGIGAVVAVIAGFRVDYRVTVIGVTIILGLMFVLVLFARQVDSSRARYGHITLSLFITWAFVILTALTPTMLFTSTFFSWPKPLSELFLIGSASEDTPPGPAEGSGPTFQPPRLAGRTIDGCISSPQFAAALNMQCVSSAQKQIADAFCRAAHYKYSNDDFQSSDTRIFQSSWKYVQEIGNDDRLSSRWAQDNTGGFIFTKISCRS